MQPTTASDVVTVTTGASTTVVATYGLSELGIVVGIVCTILSFCTSLFFHIRRERRAINETMRNNRMRKASEAREMRDAHKRYNDRT